MNAHFESAQPSNLVDSFGRTVSYLRLSVTDRCNLRCVYCMAENMQFLHKKEVLSIEELGEVAAAFVELGVKKVRLTGGEPLVRNGIDRLLGNLSELDSLDELTMTTNGILLSRYLDDILLAGIHRVNVSLDALDPEIYARLGRADQLDSVLNSLAMAKNAGLKVRLNSVILANQNEDQVLPLINYAVENGFDIAFIEEMPLGEISSHQRQATVTFNDALQEKVAQYYDLNSENISQGSASIQLHAGPARYQKISGSETRLGFISPHSNNFCGSCNRVRVTVKGQLLLCLGNEGAIDLRTILRRDDYNREQLKQIIQAGMQNKPEKHHFELGETHIVRFMSMIGG